jgi:predicted nucleic acid-binding protein
MYLLDSNIFIEAKNRHYGFDFCPAFWDWLVRENAASQVASVESVSEELRDGSDELADWAKARPNFFLPADAAVVASLSVLTEWTANTDYLDAAINEFLQEADYFLIGHALAHGFTVVTHEKPKNSKKKIQIPDACDANGVAWTDPYAMLRSEGARFVLGPSESA